ncbi:class I SAM-dependent methyltransferase [Longispora albida]|uniref:class I SAM-dependent methyltransferase n=1 Tax=Longispora albida TaxID=203523 RepID=UPI00036A6DBA|nr:class I SAM-dependent methyltransferase [Longispora albida]
MREAAAVNAAAWNHQARLAGTPDGTTAGRLELTQYPGHGPGIELLGNVTGKTVVELGCGRGHNLAALAGAGALCTGIDIAEEQIRWAQAAWPHIDFHCADALDYLTTARPADIYLSIFGAIGLTDPDQLLPAIATAMHPEAILLFTVPVPDWLGTRHDHMTTRDGRRFPVRRWLLEPGEWVSQLRSAGLVLSDRWTVTEPAGGQTCTLIFSAAQPTSMPCV